MPITQVLPRLSYPWLISSSTQHRQKIPTISYSTSEIQNALNVLDKCLEALSKLRLPPVESIPESLREYWEFSIEDLAQKMPTLNDFNLTQVAEFLKEEGIESPDEQIIEDVATWWLWSILQDITKAVLRWLEDSLKESKDTVQVLHLIDIAEHYWQNIDPHLYAQTTKLHLTSNK